MEFFAVQPRPGGTCSPRRTVPSRGRFESSTRVMQGRFPAAKVHPYSLWGCGGVGRSWSGNLEGLVRTKVHQGSRMGVS